MAIAARINRFRTRPYEPQEIASMDAREQEKIRSSRYEKMLGEQILEQFSADSLDQLRQRVSSIAETNKPNPIVVTTANADDLSIKHSFLIKRAYVPDDTEGLLEIIVFRPKDPKAYHEKKRKEAERYAVKRVTPAEAQEFLRKALTRVVEDSVSTFASSCEKYLEQLGFANDEEFRAYQLEIESKRGSFATDEEFNEYCTSEWDKKIEPARARRRAELVSKPPYWESRLPSVLNDDMTVLCRIIGKDSDLVRKCEHYYRKFHSISDPVFSVDNHADDGLEVSFVYGKDFATSKT